MPGLLCMDLHKILLPKEALLRKHGVPASVISKWIMKSPRNLTVCDDRFSEVVAELKMMGFDPSRPSYLYALHTMLGVSSSNWKRKCEAYKNLGWSEDELLKLFKKHPFCIAMSETKLRKAMEFLTKCLGWDICTILKNPCCLAFSMEKRMLPRYKVMQMLLSNGLLKKDFCWSTVFGLNEKNFLKKFVNKYQGEAPKLMNAYCKEIRV
ncbi:hypothetical protein QJS10_CPA16g01201 [Acorus calamus]|uniref:Uncharacterized protein n=1 Tax=Acorus calamus TaxID=4465 RepID=A0AAV9D5H0_ACOCL|nr:hypothetical protein QJS10_CPA16g01201 [Acorus calamus]